VHARGIFLNFAVDRVMESYKTHAKKVKNAQRQEGMTAMRTLGDMYRQHTDPADWVSIERDVRGAQEAMRMHVERLAMDE
jgi:hypothetical protein